MHRSTMRQGYIIPSRISRSRIRDDLAEKKTNQIANSKYLLKIDNNDVQLNIYDILREINHI